MNDWSGASSDKTADGPSGKGAWLRPQTRCPKDGSNQGREGGEFYMELVWSNRAVKDPLLADHLKGEHTVLPKGHRHNHIPAITKGFNKLAQCRCGNIKRIETW